VKDHPRPKTLQIGPISIQEFDELVAFIRRSLDFPGNPAGDREQLVSPEFSYPIGTIVLGSVGANADADC
jgi:hypothetical protein